MTAFLRALYQMATMIFLAIAMSLAAATPSHAAPIDDQFQAWLQKHKSAPAPAAAPTPAAAKPAAAAKAVKK